MASTFKLLDKKEDRNPRRGFGSALKRMLLNRSIPAYKESPMTAPSNVRSVSGSPSSYVEDAPSKMLLVDRAQSVTREDLLLAVEEELWRLREILNLLRFSSTQLFSPPSGSAAGARSKEKRALTPAGRMRISEAQKRRWARQRSEPLSA